MENDRQEAITSAVRAIRQRWGDQAVRTSVTRNLVSFIPTWYQALDNFLYGVPRGHISEFSGSGTSGMTTVAYHAAAQAQSQGDVVVYLDLRYSFDPYYAADCSLEIQSLILVRLAVPLVGLDIAYQLIAENAAGLIIVNSTAELLAAPGVGQMLSASLRKIVPTLRKSRCALLFLTPVRSPSTALFCLAPTAF